MFEPFILNALAAGIGISLMTGSLGCFVAWQRLAYFGDTVAHAAVLGVVLALLMSADIIYGMVGIALLIALIMSAMHSEKTFSNDSLLGIAAHSSLALALVILSLSPSITLDVNGLLFGDILATSGQDIFMIYALAMCVFVMLVFQWNNFIRYVLHADIARVEGLNIVRMRLLMMIMIALVVAISIKLVGILLITSLLILPAATARLLAQNPTQMAIYSTGISIIAVIAGVMASLHYDTPTGPSIILSALGMFVIVRVIPAKAGI